MVNINKMPPARTLRRYFDYNKNTGIARWLVALSNRAAKGTVAGSKNGNGYLQCRIKGKIYPLHRLIFKLVCGREPRGEIDHKNGIRTDNRLCNLREATSRQNKANASLRGDSTTSSKGVRLQKRTGKYESHITDKGKIRHLGTYQTRQQAHRAYCRAARKLHGEFARYE